MTPNKRGTLKVEYVPIKSVKPAKGNTRIHPPEQVDQIRASIKAFGWTKPIVVDERREILAGHGALQAAQQDGLTEVPIIARHGLSQAQKRAYRTADNKIGDNSTWDMKLLGTELASLKDMGFDMTLTGFGPSEIEAILRPPPSHHTEPPTQDTAGPAVSVLGDLWQLGDHRLICADSTKPTTYQTLMNGRQAALVFTDPPYGISYEAPSGKFEMLKGDGLRRGQLTKMLGGAFASSIEHTTKEAPWYVWHASATREDFAHAMRDVGLVEVSYIIWAKPGQVLGWSDYRWSHEPCFYAVRQGHKPAFYGDRTETTVWRVAARTRKAEPAIQVGAGMIIAMPTGEEMYIAPGAPKGKKVRHVQLQKGETLSLATNEDTDDLWEVSRDNGHGKEESIDPTQKPVELARRAVKNSSREGEIVLDFFAGSGSTLIACEQLKRACYAVELEPMYVDAIVRRWQTATGKQATHAKDQKTFEAIAKARAGKKAR